MWIGGDTDKVHPAAYLEAERSFTGAVGSVKGCFDVWLGPVWSALDVQTKGSVDYAEYLVDLTEQCVTAILSGQGDKTGLLRSVIGAAEGAGLIEAGGLTDGNGGKH